MKQDCFLHAMYFGLVLGALFILEFIFHSFSGFWFGLLAFALKVIIPIAAVKMAIDCRKRVNDNQFTYGQAFRYMFRLFMYAVIIGCVFVFIYLKWLNLNFIPQLKEETVSTMEQFPQILSMFQLSESEFEEAANKMYTVNTFTGAIFIQYVVISLAISLVGAAFAKRKAD
jgi:hypothetical protein